jgi:hypothetical protein
VEIVILAPTPSAAELPAPFVEPLRTIVVRDRSDEHNFRLIGPGVNKATGVDFTGGATWRVRLLKGKTHRFVSDPHASHMRGSFRGR